MKTPIRTTLTVMSLLCLPLVGCAAPKKDTSAPPDAITADSIAMSAPAADYDYDYADASVSEDEAMMEGDDAGSPVVADLAEAEAPAMPMDAPAREMSVAGTSSGKVSRIASRRAERQARRQARTKAKKSNGSKAIAATPTASTPTAATSTAQQPIQAPPQTERKDNSNEGYDRITEQNFTAVAQKPLSTFSIDVDTASYSNVRRYLQSGSLPPVDAVRIEEMVNYFSYNYPQPRGDRPFSVTTEVADCPWDQSHRLVHIGLKGKELSRAQIPPRNLVFLLDVSGSMNSHDKLPLLKQALGMVVKQLDARDRVSIVVYAGASGVVLNPTAGNLHDQIMGALNRLSAGGSTNGGQGIELAYKLAQQSFVRGGINRVILATDGDFNVGVTSRNQLERLIEQKRQSGVFLSVLGFGTGNIKDSQMEMLADKGNGNYAYIDSSREAHKVLVEELGSTLVTIAKDVKIQVEFNPSMVKSYRLIGYENRALADRDFNDDRKDAGEIGAGHTVTALYEVVPRGNGGTGVDPLRYQQEGDHTLTSAANSGEMMYLKLRYKKPSGSRSTLVTYPILESDHTLAQSSQNFRFSAAVAGFGMLLRNSEHAGETSFHQLHGLAQSALGNDPKGYRREFLNLVKKAGHLRGEQPSVAIAR